MLIIVATPRARPMPHVGRGALHHPVRRGGGPYEERHAGGRAPELGSHPRRGRHHGLYSARLSRRAEMACGEIGDSPLPPPQGASNTLEQHEFPLPPTCLTQHTLQLLSEFPRSAKIIRLPRIWAMAADSIRVSLPTSGGGGSGRAAEDDVETDEMHDPLEGDDAASTPPAAGETPRRPQKRRRIPVACGACRSKKSRVRLGRFPFSLERGTRRTKGASHIYLRLVGLRIC